VPAGALNIAQGGFGEALIAAVGAASGLSVGGLHPDPGSDLVLADRASGEAIFVQVKTESHPRFVGENLHYDLDVAHYDHLRMVTSVRRFLVVLAVPPAQADWLQAAGDCYEGRQLAYWTSVRGGPATTNTSSITVPLPLANLVTPASLRFLVEEG
jgi:hypothetical protein